MKIWLRVTPMAWLLAVALALAASAAEPAAGAAKTARAIRAGAERAASEDAEIAQFHALGPVTGAGEIFRSANPVRDLVRDNGTPIDAARLARATARMQRLRDRGIRTVMCFQHPDGGERVQVALEQQAAGNAGLAFVIHPLSNSGANSFETMTDAEALAAIAPIAEEIARRARAGGVLFHCKAGHDRTGIVAAYLRMKFQGWSAAQAIAEMRRDGHDWKKYSREGRTNSWLEEHLQAWETGTAKPARQGAATGNAAAPDGGRR